MQIISNILRQSLLKWQFLLWSLELKNVCHDKILLIICYNVYLNDFFNTFRPTPLRTHDISYFIPPSNLLLSLLTLTSIPMGHFIEVRVYIKYFVLHGMKDQQKEKTCSLQKKLKSMTLTMQTNMTNTTINHTFIILSTTFYYLWKACFISLTTFRKWDKHTFKNCNPMLNTGNPNCFNSSFIVDTLNSILLHPISFSLHLQDHYYL